MRKTRDAYLAEPPDVAARGILDTLVGRTQEMDGALAAARRTTNWSVGLLCGSTLVNFVLVILT
jgi:hypothetical protein